ncbi:MAG TPA: carbohydrate-binding family 9-like protein, partial [Polyangiaceae bacterium]|nr:carbohydrate-binding family 9-like protein [Polyangiaceae bacterium]
MTGRARRWSPLALLLVLVLGGCVRSSAEQAKKAREKVKAYILDALPGDVTHKLDVDFDGKIKLLAVRVEPEGSLKPGQQLKLTMYWKCEKKLDSGWSLFTHVLDSSGERVLNVDNVGPLREAKDGKQQLYPPSFWEPGKVYADVQTFSVPSTIKGDSIKIMAGIWKDTDRLKIGAGPHDSANRASIASISLLGAQRSKPRSTRVPTLRVDRLASGVQITIDGKLDEEAWKSAPGTGPLVDVRSGEPNTSFPINGNAKLLWNEEGMFVGFEVQDADIQGGFAKDKKDPHLWTKDTIEIMVDPDGDGDNQDYYEIQVGPQNLVFD